jgi:hypothetical protein
VANGKWELTGVYDAAGNLMPRGAKPPTLLEKPGYPDK